jgi:O-succinylbenzoate synthase
MTIERIEVRLLALPLVESFAAAHGTTAVRHLVVVRAETAVGAGWGECAALPEPTYTDEFAAGAFAVLEEELAPRIVGHRVGVVGLGSHLSLVAANPMATAALEMAMLDLELRAAGRSLASRLGSDRPGAGGPDGDGTVPAGAAVGLGTTAQVLDRVTSLAQAGFARMKLKIQPGHDLEVVTAVLERLPDLEVHVDGNGSFRRRHLGLLAELAAAGVGAVEQPFAPHDVDTSARLVASSPVPVVADEAATDVEAVERLWRAGALSGVSVKPPRLGGIAAARRMHDWCRQHGVHATAGGMMESGLGRHALAAVAGLPGFTLTGDVSPARRWLSVDPWPDLVMSGDRIEIPSRPGVAPDPDHEVLDRHTVAHTVVKA